MSQNCNERYYELIGSIIAVPDSVITFSIPFNLDKKGNEPSFFVSENNKVKVPMSPRSGALKETENVTEAGRSYEVTVSWEIEQVDRDTYSILESLESQVNHLIVRTFPENDLFIRAVPEAYSFSYEESDGVLSCELTIHNLTGAQRML